MKKWFYRLVWSFALVLTYAAAVVHRATFVHPVIDEGGAHSPTSSSWIPKSEAGIHQLVLSGDAYSRGLAAGKATKHLLDLQEQKLVELLETMIPSRFVRTGFFLGMMRWFWGIEKFFLTEHTDEMFGVSKSASPTWNYYADPFTRQLAYHGIHEVGQFFADAGSEGMGCTVFAIPERSGWVVGRNFDFEGGRVFDEEKIMKWVFPERGHAFVSVIWAGMVGAVTGVNAHGLYVSINAAGTTDFRRYGTPSTLVALEVLQNARDVGEAEAILTKATLFVSDTFVLADRQRAVRVEKSPRRIQSIELEGPSVVSNHFVHESWNADSINRFRKEKLTSLAREQRGQELLHQIYGKQRLITSGSSVKKVLQFLRDKQAVGGAQLHLGNRAAIDALIATHAVIYESGTGRFYVSQGPSLVGQFLGFDLNASFAQRRPVRQGSLAADAQVSLEQYRQIQSRLAALADAEAVRKQEGCEAEKERLDRIGDWDHSSYLLAVGKNRMCLGDREAAKAALLRARDLQPPYASQREQIERALQ